MQAGLFLLIGPLLGFIGLAPELSVSWSPLRMLLAAGFLTLIAAELTALGFVIACQINSTQGYHAVMSLFLMPMWLLSGAFFPGGESGWLHWLIRANPLTYGVAGLRRVLYAQSLPITPELPSLAVCLTTTCCVTIALVLVATWMVARRDPRNAV